MLEKSENERQQPLIVFGTEWCSAAVWARNYLEKQGVAFQWVDVNDDSAARTFLKEQTGGYASVPTFRFPDGEILVEPSIGEMQRRFGNGVGNFLDRLLARFGGSS